MNDEQVIKRLALIKYLYGIGKEQAEKLEPMCWTAILTFQDSVELFLGLIAEYADISASVRDIKFMQYWEKLEKPLKDLHKPGVTKKIAMERLNNARVNFKHYGNPPSQSAITEDFQVNAQIFFEENTNAILGLNFHDVSILDLISNDRVRIKLRKAQDSAKLNNSKEAIEAVAIAFAELIADYETKVAKIDGSHFDYVERFPVFDKSQIGNELDHFIDATQTSLENLSEAVKIIGFGLDYRRYTRFKKITPYVVHHSDGKNYFSSDLLGVRSKIPISDVLFCIQFVIESALALQEDIKG